MVPHRFLGLTFLLVISSSRHHRLTFAAALRSATPQGGGFCFSILATGKAQERRMNMKF
jgi:hypothetical protein